MQLKNFELRDPVKIYNKISFTELKKLAPAINWDGYYKSYGLKTDTLVVWNKDYLKTLNQLVKQTPVEIAEDLLPVAGAQDLCRWIT